MSLEEGQRALKPAQVAGLVPWDKLEGALILCLGRKGQPNHIVMSSLTVEELTLLSAQLNSHINLMLMNSLIEEVPSGLDT